MVPESHIMLPLEPGDQARRQPKAVRDDQPLSGVFRVMYFLATAILTLLVLVTAITAFYDPPEGTSDDFDFGLEGTVVQVDDSKADYNRNVSLIFQVTSAALFATAILGLGSRFNPLRAALVLGGIAVYLTGVGFWAESSDQWLGFLTTIVNFAVLGIGFLWLEEGLPLGPTGEVRRMEIPAAVPIASAPPPPAPPPPPPAYTPPPPPPPSLEQSPIEPPQSISEED